MIVPFEEPEYILMLESWGGGDVAFSWGSDLVRTSSARAGTSGLDSCSEAVFRRRWRRRYQKYAATAPARARMVTTTAAATAPLLTPDFVVVLVLSSLEIHCAYAQVLQSLMSAEAAC